MYTKHRSYTLAGKEHYHARVMVDPTGYLHIDIMEESDELDGEFESLSFKTQDRKTELTCQDAEHDWRIALQGQDARELVTLIEEAKEEYETLMRDLC
ncbi:MULTISPECIES: hypothetical protein [Vibrio]|uniref:Uncharacterized protein n=1 Tax=Vibrio ostreae TaxID=2841925 RepID=A0A975UBL4_9VIBR|nr:MULTISPECIES: hypothetical protein [Vibrio]QXO18560.1 hypothetical protein KNV97_09940 [Vibrio ostreae]WGY47142.1 hypothetical protein J0X00_20455 [Vibrio sp. ABG19]